MAVGSAAAARAVVEQRERTPAAPGWARWLPVAAIAVGCVPVVVALVWAVRIGWWPAADDALIAFRSRDVFTTDTPLVGMPSTIGTDADAVGYHLGPMGFWVMAVPLWLFGGLGLALAAGAVNLASIVAIGLLCRRRGGAWLVVVAMAVVALLAASLGRDLLISPWNPHIALLPMLAMFVAAWLTAEGRAWALPVLALSGSFVAQAHLGYIGLAAVVGLWALACHLWQVRRARREGAAAAGGRLGTPYLVAAAILVVCWGPVLWQQVTSDPGNLRVVAESLQDPQDEPRGGSFATDAVARSVGVVPLWARGPLEDRDVAAVYVDPGFWHVVSFTAVVLVLVGLAAATWRRRADRRLTVLVATGLVVLAAAWFTAGRLPIGPASLYRVRWLWPVAAFVWLAAVVGLASLAPRRWRTGARPLGAVVVAALAFTLVAARSDPGSTEAQDTGTLDAIEQLADAAEADVDSGTWLVRASGNEAFLGARTGLVWQLRERGFDVRMPAEEDNARLRLGDDLTATEEESAGTLQLTSGPLAFEDQGGRLLAVADASPGGRRDELLATRDLARSLLERNRPRLSRTGEAWLRDDPTGERRREERALQDLLDRDPTELLESRFLDWVALGLVEIPGPDRDIGRDLGQYDRYYVERQFRLELQPAP